VGFNKKNILGIGVVKLLITLAIVSILFTLALPSFNNFIKDSRLTTSTNIIINAFNLARFEAISRKKNISVSKSSNHFNIFEMSSQMVLKNIQTDLTGITLSPKDLPEVTYLGTGYRLIADNSEVTVKLCDDRNVGKEITISPAGKLSLNGGALCP